MAYIEDRISDLKLVIRTKFQQSLFILIHSAGLCQSIGSR